MSESETQEEQSFEKVMGRLEEVVESLEKGGIPLEESLKLFEEGIVLSREASGRLDQAERRIEELLSDNSVVNFDKKPTEKDSE